MGVGLGLGFVGGVALTSSIYYSLFGAYTDLGSRGISALNVALVHPWHKFLLGTPAEPLWRLKRYHVLIYRKVSKPPDLCLEVPDRSSVWLAMLEGCCWGNCRITWRDYTASFNIQQPLTRLKKHCRRRTKSDTHVSPHAGKWTVRCTVIIFVLSVPLFHCWDVIMGSIASQFTSLTIVYSTVYSGADQRKHQSSASLAFVRGIHRIPRTKGQ